MDLRLAATVMVLTFAIPAWAGLSPLTIAVSCVADEKVDAASAELVCEEMNKAVTQTYSSQTLSKHDQTKWPSLVVTIHTATAKAAELMLTWTAKNGQVFRGDRMSVSTMDTSLNPSKRAALYRRALAANPMPSN